ncbi:ATP-binding protein [Thiomicrospira microaerophila]|uniref:AAA family ATPase n=1 Tax=Thiomicrospira microaerophila TaxID=406020 RepID=UPI00200FED39|nr:AAA family ATPase [Thiomicrospira microaerophila]UQB42270.1 ATP-binding protein [Thiomicrospira microaerophila]
MVKVELKSNILHKKNQSFEIGKYVALIGENGSGKSSILQGVFEGQLSGEILSSWKLVCFSSGHNERYSRVFSNYLKKSRKLNSGFSLSSFYYDKSWAPLLIFLASVLDKSGKVRELLRALKLVEEEQTVKGGEDKDDISTSLSFGFRVDRPYVNKVAEALKKEELGEIDTIRNTPYFRTLSSFIENTIDSNYEFEDIISNRDITIKSENIFNVSFESPIQDQADSNRISENPVVAFFTQAIDSNNPITKTSLKLNFIDGVSLNDISDGEYQLLFVYSLFDLFDSENTIFLFDEADSHLHYKNIGKLWDRVINAKGRSLVTTHQLDSISEIGAENILVVSQGRVLPCSERRELQERLEQISNINKTALKTYSLYERIVLMDNENDWQIFIRLVKKKLGEERYDGVDSFLKKFCCVSVESGWDSHTSSFAAKKLKWLESFTSYLDGASYKAKSVYLICDRDNLPLASINTDSLELKGTKSLLTPIARDAKFKSSILVWRRREIKHYLLSYTALASHNALKKINNDSLGLACHLHLGMNGDYQCQVDEESGNKAPIASRHFEESSCFNEGLAQLSSERVKQVLRPIIENDKGLDIERLQAYIDLIPADEISEDITNMYNFITGKL